MSRRKFTWPRELLLRSAEAAISRAEKRPDANAALLASLRQMAAFYRGKP